MFTAIGFFAETPCPQQGCDLLRCIFQHPKTSMVSSHLNQGPTTFQHPVAIPDGPNKRQKLDPAMQLLAKPIPIAAVGSIPRNDKPTPASWTQKASVKSSLELPSKNTLRARRDVSPPPLRKNALPTKVAQPGKQKSKTPAKTPAKTPVRKPAEQETLNPRFIKSAAPAPHDMRYRLLKALYDQFNRLNTELAKDSDAVKEKLVLSNQNVIILALEAEEEAAYKPAIYSNLVKNKILAYKRMTVQNWKEERLSIAAKAKAASAALATPSAGTIAQPPPPITTGLTPEQELEILKKLVAPIKDLEKHGYVISVPTATEIESAKLGIEAAKGWEVCERCKTRFQVFPGRREEDGALTSGGKCTYHNNKTYFQERSATEPKSKREKKYRCCHQSLGDSHGCMTGESHVFRVNETKRLAAVLNFEETPENKTLKDFQPLCIDGEMGFTVNGLELIRLTATAWPSGKEVFDVLVRPLGEIIDLNSQWSGVQPQDMTEAEPFNPSSDNDTEQKEKTSEKRKLQIVESPMAARELLFSHLTPKTPLIGHGLENDLNSVRIIHPTLIDTALLFPHRAGLPYRNSLKQLMQTHLKRDIQVVHDDKAEGHDSKEDANAAGDLVRFALAREWEKLRRDGWKFRNTGFLAPPRLPSPPLWAPTGPRAMSPSVDALAVRVAPLPIIARKRSRSEAERDAEDGEIIE